MNERASFKQILGELHWKVIGISTAIITALQVLAWYTVHYPLAQSLTLTVLFASYIVVPRAKTHKVANAFTSVVVVFVVGMIVTLAIDPSWREAIRTGHAMAYLQLCGFALILGLSMAYAYVRLTNWSDRKKAQIEAKRNAKAMPERTIPAERVHRKKKRRK